VKVERIVFADTAFWIALTYKRDQLHLPAQAWRRYIAAAGAKVVTTEPVDSSPGSSVPDTTAEQ
jgi:predicted nucleic acid-binding protein